MFSFFGKTNKPLKGYKITSVDRKQKYGIAADSLTMLQEKAAHKMKVNQNDAFILHFEFTNFHHFDLDRKL